MRASFRFGFEFGIWDLVVLVPDHCISFYFPIRVAECPLVRERAVHSVGRSCLLCNGVNLSIKSFLFGLDYMLRDQNIIMLFLNIAFLFFFLFFFLFHRFRFMNQKH